MDKAEILGELQARIAEITDKPPAQSPMGTARPGRTTPSRTGPQTPGVQRWPDSMRFNPDTPSRGGLLPPSAPSREGDDSLGAEQGPFPQSRRDRKRAAGNAKAVGDPADEQAAFKKIIDLVNASDKPEAAIRERLRQRGFEQPAIDGAVERAKGYGFIDDMRYAEVLVRSRVAQGKGAAGIERELKSLGIDPYELEEFNAAFGVDGPGDEAEVARALELLAKKPPRAKNMRDAGFRKLVNKGYSVSVASRAVREWADSREDGDG